MNGSRIPSTTDYFAVGIISGSGLAYEILLLRVFSYSQWSHFASIAISLAMLGFGVAGTVLALLGKRCIKLGDRLFMGGIVIAVVGMLTAMLLSQAIAVRPLFAVWDFRELTKILILDLACFIPFFGIALSIGHLFIRWPEWTKHLYSANLLGSGIGALVPVLLLSVLLLEHTLLVMPLLLLLSGTLLGLSQPGMRKGGTGCLIGLILIGLWMGTGPPQLRVSDFKKLAYLMDLPDAKVVARHPGIRDQLTKVRSESIRIAPGLSFRWDTAVPSQDALVAGSDEVIPLQILPHQSDAPAYHEAMVGYLPFILRQQGTVAILGASEWLPVSATQDRQTVWVLEDEEVAHQMRKHYRPTTIEFQSGNLRRFLSQHSKPMEIIYFNRCFSGGMATSEDYLLTREGIRTAIEKLQPGGLLAIPLKIQYPPRHTTKLVRMIDAVLREADVKQPSTQVVALRSIQQALFLVSNGTFDASDIAKIKTFSERWNFDLIALPGLDPNQSNQYNSLPEPAHLLSARAILDQRGAVPTVADWYQSRIATDSNPYFWHSMEWSKVPQLLHSFGRQGLIWLDWDILATVVKLVAATVTAAILIILPLGKLPRGSGHLTRLSICLYFAALGFGFLFFEMVVFQRCNLFFANHIISAAMVFSLFLIGAGIGSLSTPANFRAHAPIIIFLPIMGAAILAYTFLFPGKEFLLELPSWLRYPVVGLTCLPLAWSLGRAFPWGLRQLDSLRPLIPWAWGINGFVSVLASPVATLLSIYFNHPATWISGMLCYLVAAVVALSWQFRGPLRN